MRTTLYIIWFLLPLVFFAIALWGLLERLSKKPKTHNPGDFVKQGGFLLVCALISLAIDQLILEDLVQAIFGDWLPFGLFETLLLPCVLLVMSMLVGPSKNIYIKKSPHPTDRRKR